LPIPIVILIGWVNWLLHEIHWSMAHLFCTHRTRTVDCSLQPLGLSGKTSTANCKSDCCEILYDFYPWNRYHSN